MELNPNSRNHIPNYQIAGDLVNDMIQSFNILNFYKICFAIKDDGSINKEFGLLVDLIIISSKDTAYYCEFILDG